MNAYQAILKMNEVAKEKGYPASQAQAIVWGNYSHRVERGMKVQDFSRTYERNNEKLHLTFNAALNEIY